MLIDTRLKGCPPSPWGGTLPLPGYTKHTDHGHGVARVGNGTEDAHISLAAPSSGRATAPAAPVSLCYQNPLDLCHHLHRGRSRCWTLSSCSATWKKPFPHTACNPGCHIVLNWKTPFLKHHTDQGQPLVQDSQNTGWLQQSRKAWVQWELCHCFFGVFGYELRQLKHLYVTDAVTIFVSLWQRQLRRWRSPNLERFAKNAEAVGEGAFGYGQAAQDSVGQTRLYLVFGTRQQPLLRSRSHTDT